MITPESLQLLRERLSDEGGDGAVSLAQFGKLLGGAIGRYPYSRSYVSKLLAGKAVITPRIAEAAQALMVYAAVQKANGGSEGRPSFDGQPIEKMKAAEAQGIGWQELYAQDAGVRQFVDALMNVILGG